MRADQPLLLTVRSVRDARGPAASAHREVCERCARTKRFCSLLCCGHRMDLVHILPVCSEMTPHDDISSAFFSSSVMLSNCGCKPVNNDTLQLHVHEPV